METNDLMGGEPRQEKLIPVNGFHHHRETSRETTASKRKPVNALYHCLFKLRLRGISLLELKAELWHWLAKSLTRSTLVFVIHADFIRLLISIRMSKIG